VLLEEGRVTQIGTPQEIRDAPSSRYAADLVGINAFHGRLRRLEDGGGWIDVDGGEVFVPWPEDAEEGGVMAVLRPAHVTVSRESPTGSARNAFVGRVTSVAIDGDRARIRMSTRPPLVAEITTASVDRLGLREGVQVWASFKAVEVQVIQV
jgi:molybdate transport system ATP-binding protein